MADTAKQLALATTLSHEVEGATIYTVPGSTSAVVRRATITNSSPRVDAWCTLFSDTGIIYSGMIRAAQTVAVPLDTYLATGELIGAREVTDMVHSGMSVTSMANINSPTDTTTYSTGSWASVVDGIYIASVVNTHASAAEIPSSWTADATHGISWVQEQTVLGLNGTVRLTQFRTKATAAASGTSTVNFSGTQTNCQVSIARLVGGSTSGTNGRGAIQAAGTRSPFTQVTGIWVPATHWCGGRYAAFGTASGTGAFTPGIGFTEELEVGGTSRLQTEWTIVAGHAAAAVGDAAPASSVAGLLNIQSADTVLSVLLEGVEIT